MKRLLSIFLLLCISAPFWLNYSIFYWSRMNIQADVIGRIFEGLGESEQTVLRLSKQEAEKEIVWEHSKEFRYKGQFYDIISVQELPDSVYYTCYWDKEETFITDLFEGILFEELTHDFQDDATASHLVEVIKTPYKLDQFSWSALDRLPQPGKHQQTQQIYNPKNLSPPSPPPKSV
ncbi:MAG: hypothetical protein RIG68_09935 [Imperialibacter sp.]|uniref:hypothetical protein n=1 Tax=Imperialibacter sp. TaxID=2038411 RepID=UPI0032EE02F2